MSTVTQAINQGVLDDEVLDEAQDLTEKFNSTGSNSSHLLYIFSCLLLRRSGDLCFEQRSIEINPCSIQNLPG